MDCVVVESKVERGKGSVITLLVKEGTLNVGDILVVGTVSGKVRALINDEGKRINKAGPSMPVEVLGLSGTPDAGEVANVVETESRAREIAEYRLRKSKQKEATLSSRGSVEQMLANIQTGEASELPVIIKSLRFSKLPTSKHLFLFTREANFLSRDPTFSFGNSSNSFLETTSPRTLSPKNSRFS